MDICMHDLRWKGKICKLQSSQIVVSQKSITRVFYLTPLIFNSVSNSKVCSAQIRRVCRKKLPFLSYCFWLWVELNPQPTLIPHFLHKWRHPGTSNFDMT